MRRQVHVYNLDAVISVGYRVSSRHGTQFRIGATNVLRDHLVKGHPVNAARLRDLDQDVRLVADTTRAAQLRRCSAAPGTASDRPQPVETGALAKNPGQRVALEPGAEDVAAQSHLGVLGTRRHAAQAGQQRPQQVELLQVGFGSGEIEFGRNNRPVRVANDQPLAAEGFRQGIRWRRFGPVGNRPGVRSIRPGVLRIVRPMISNSKRLMPEKRAAS